MIHVLKMLKGMIDVDSSQYLTTAKNNLRVHSYKLFKPRFRLDCGKFFLGNRIVDEWNLLPEDVVSCRTVNSFKIKIDQYLR